MSSAAISLPPPLIEGDRLNARQFLHRWEAMPDLKHAELIDGTVLMPSPVSKNHSKFHGALGAWLWFYADMTPGCEMGVEGTWVMGPDDVPQPDASLRILPAFGGQSHDTGDYTGGAPELVVEVSGSSSARDLSTKLELYRRVGVREYVTVLLQSRRVVWRELVNGSYKEITVGPDGYLRSRVFPGLWLDPAALWDTGRSLRQAVEEGTKSEEHAGFVRYLSRLMSALQEARTGGLTASSPDDLRREFGLEKG